MSDEAEVRKIRDPFLNKTVEISSRITDRLRDKYASGPTMENGEPEFGWRYHETTPIQREAADLIEALRAERDEALAVTRRRILETQGIDAEYRKLEAERDAAVESAAFWKTEADRLANGPPTRHPPEFVAQVLMDREGRSDPMALARLTEVIRCARLDGRKQARDEARATAEALK